MKIYGIEAMLAALKMFISERIITDSIYDPTITYELCVTEEIKAFCCVDSATCINVSIDNGYKTVDVKVVVCGDSTEDCYEMSFEKDEFDALINIARLKAHTA